MEAGGFLSAKLFSINYRLQLSDGDLITPDVFQVQIMQSTFLKLDIGLFGGPSTIVP